MASTRQSQLELTDHGTIQRWLSHHPHRTNVLFNNEEGIGPCWYGQWDDQSHHITLSYNELTKAYTSNQDGLVFSLRYEVTEDTLTIHSSLQNQRTVPFQPKKCGLKLGINTSMASYPDWLTKFFPSYLRCEKTHFTGYLMSPDGQVIVLASPDPIASWSLDYNTNYSQKNKSLWGGHRISTLNLDLLHEGTLPERHPQNLHTLRAGEEKHWHITLQRMDTLDDMATTLAELTGGPTFQVDQIQMQKGDQITLNMHTHLPLHIKVISPQGQLSYYGLTPNANHLCNITIQGEEEGLYTLTAENTQGKISQAIVSVTKPYSWYMNKSAEGALHHLPRGTSHCESYYGFYTLYEHMKIDPVKRHLDATETLFDTIYPLIFNENEPTVHPHRIQNTACMVNLLVNRYEVTKDLEHIHRAVRLADWLIHNYQAEDGSYRGGKTHYTSVIYPGKNLMALMAVEKELAKQDSSWLEIYHRHYNSVKAAMDELVRSDGNIDTEGELTFEDGMISCSATQLAEFALLQEDEERRDYYKASAIRYLKQHTCLTHLFIPDSRMRGGTLRFWEAQYDIGMQYNFLNSPHGWSSWRTYATYYMYLLTGDLTYLIQTMNAIGSATQVIDFETGKLRWAFVVDPHVEVKQLTESCKPLDIAAHVSGHYSTAHHAHATFTIGEEYVDMVSHWQGANMQDNDVHEHFKCMAEVVLTKAYVHEKADGTYVTWNCRAMEDGDLLVIIPNEDIITSLCVHVENSTTVKVDDTLVGIPSGFSWHRL